MIRRHARTLMPIAALAIGAEVGTAVFTGNAGAETTDVVRSGAAEDSYSSSSRPTYNFGASDTLVAGRLGGDTMVSYLKFTVANPGTGVKVKGAQVTLTRDSRAFPSAITLSKVADTAWTEKAISARNDPAIGAILNTVKPKADAATVTFGASSVVKGAGTYTFAVTSTVANSPARFRSAEAHLRRRRPRWTSCASTSPRCSPSTGRGPASAPAPTRRATRHCCASCFTPRSASPHWPMTPPARSPSTPRTPTAGGPSGCTRGTPPR
jgi:hypothetical protein